MICPSKWFEFGIIRQVTIYEKHHTSLKALVRMFNRLDCDMFLMDIESRTKLIGKLLGILLLLKEHWRDAMLVLGLPFELGEVFVDESYQILIPLRP